MLHWSEGPTETEGSTAKTAPTQNWCTSASCWQEMAVLHHAEISQPGSPVLHSKYSIMEAVSKMKGTISFLIRLQKSCCSSKTTQSYWMPGLLCLLVNTKTLGSVGYYGGLLQQKTTWGYLVIYGLTCFMIIMPKRDCKGSQRRPSPTLLLCSRWKTYQFHF